MEILRNSMKFVEIIGNGKNLEIIHLMEKNFINKKNMNLYVNSTFYKDINNFNEIFVNNQINNIKLNINKKLPIDTDVKKKICINWCEKYNL